MNGISVSRLFVSWVRAVLVAGALGPSIVLAQSADTGTESASAESGAKPVATVAADASASVSSRTGAAQAFYVRTGVALDWSEQVRFKDDDCLSVTPRALYGCGPGSDGAPLSSLGDFGTVAGFEIGVGRVATPSLRSRGYRSVPPEFFFRRPRQFHAGQNVQEDGFRRFVLPCPPWLPPIWTSTRSDCPGSVPLDPFVGGGYRRFPNRYR